MIRIALGARRSQLVMSVIRQSAALAATGVVLGTVAAAGLTRTLRSFLFDVSTLDVPTFAAVAAILIAVAILASLLPARRAVKQNALTALRE